MAEIVANQSRGDFLALNHDPKSATFAGIAEAFSETLGRSAISFQILGLPKLKRADIQSFRAHGYPGILVFDTADNRNPNYHCMNGPDDESTLDFGFATQAVKSAVFATATVLEVLAK